MYYVKAERWSEPEKNDFKVPYELAHNEMDSYHGMMFFNIIIIISLFIAIIFTIALYKSIESPFAMIIFISIFNGFLLSINLTFRCYKKHMFYQKMLLNRILTKKRTE